MAGSQALASCASDSSGSWKRIKHCCCWLLQSSVQGSLNGRVSRSNYFTRSLALKGTADGRATAVAQGHPAPNRSGLPADCDCATTGWSSAPAKRSWKSSCRWPFMPASQRRSMGCSPPRKCSLKSPKHEERSVLGAPHWGRQALHVDPRYDVRTWLV